MASAEVAINCLDLFPVVFQCLLKVCFLGKPRASTNIFVAFFWSETFSLEVEVDCVLTVVFNGFSRKDGIAIVRFYNQQ